MAAVGYAGALLETIFRIRIETGESSEDDYTEPRAFGDYFPAMDMPRDESVD
jgi:hypothetical protein